MQSRTARPPSRVSRRRSSIIPPQSGQLSGRFSGTGCGWIRITSSCASSSAAGSGASRATATVSAVAAEDVSCAASSCPPAAQPARRAAASGITHSRRKTDLFFMAFASSFQCIGPSSGTGRVYTFMVASGKGEVKAAICRQMRPRYVHFTERRTGTGRGVRRGQASWRAVSSLQTARS